MAAAYLFQGGDEKLRLYPKSDIKKILNGTGYHSEEWVETDDESEYEEGTIFTNYIYCSLFAIKLIY
jgi:hypothetical protein